MLANVRPRAPRSAALAFLALVALAGALPARTAHAQDLLPPKTLDRRFPAFQFCPIPLSLEFVANGPMATLEFTGNIFASDPVNGVLYVGQKIDNIAVCPAATFAANNGFPPQFSDASRCYTGNKVGSFFFNRTGLSLNLLELFDTNPAARGWDLTHGAVYLDASDINDSNISGPRNPEADADYTGGCLKLGVDSPGGSPADSATTSVVVSGLVSGQSYTLSGWWFVGNIPQDQNTFDPLGNVVLKIRILGSGGTPIARRTWGSLKSQYR